MNSFFHNKNYYLCYTDMYKYMKRIRDDNDDDNNIKYIHKPTIVKDTDPLMLIGTLLVIITIIYIK